MAIGHLTAFLIAQAATLPTWELERSVDPITDSGLVTLTMKEGDGELLIGCQSVRGHGYYLMVVKGPRFLGNFDQREVILRFDHSTPMHRLWHYRDAMAATEHAEDVIIWMRQSQRLVVRLTTYQGDFVDLTFSMATAGTALDRLQRECPSAVAHPG